MEKVKEKIERLKGKAKIFLDNDIKIFIIDISDNYSFCNILSLGEDYLYIENFAGKKQGKKEKIMWFDIIKLEEYKEFVENGQ